MKRILCLALAICIVIGGSISPFYAEPNGYKLLELDEKPEDAGEVISTINRTEQIEMWHYSGGYWESKKYNTKITDAQLGKSPQKLAELLAQNVKFEIPLPQKVKDAVAEGKKVTVGIEAGNGLRAADIFDLGRERGYEIKDGVLYFSAFPKFNFVLNEEDGELLNYRRFVTGLAKAIPFVDPVYGTNTYSMFGKRDVNLNGGYTRNYINPTHLEEILYDGSIHPSQIIDTNGNLKEGFMVESAFAGNKGEYPSKDLTVGKGTFNNAGAVGLIFVYPLKITFYEQTEVEGESIEFTINHYEEGTDNEVYPSDHLSNPENPLEAYAKSGIGLDGNEWICTLPSPQIVEVVDGGEYNFYYTKKPVTPPAGEGQLILVKDPLVKADCKMPGRTRQKKNDGSYFPDGQPLYRGDNFKPTGTIKNQNGRDVFVEYKMTLKDKPDKNFRQINYKSDEGIIQPNRTLTDNFTKKIDNNDRYGNVYVLTVEARQRIIVPTPPPKPGPKPTKPSKPSKPRRSNYDSSSDYDDALDRYYDRLDDYYEKLDAYYEKLEAWYIKVERWEAYVAQWGDPDTGEVFIYKRYGGRDIWFSERYGWRNGKGEDMNFVMPNIQTNIEDMDGGLKPGVIVE